MNKRNEIPIPATLRSSSDTSTSASSLGQYNIGNFTTKALELAIANEIEEKELHGSGAGGRICVNDVKKFLSRGLKNMKCSGVNSSGQQCKKQATGEFDQIFFCSIHLAQAKKEKKRMKDRLLEKKLKDMNLEERLDNKLKELDELAEREKNAQEESENESEEGGEENSQGQSEFEEEVFEGSEEEDEEEFF